jgi:hypothetical protein
MFRLLSIGLTAALCGCGAGYTFTPWVGPQQNWTTGPGGYVKVVDHVSIFPPGQYPPRPYVVLGAVSTDSEEHLAKAVKEQRADAALLSVERSYRSGTVAVAAPGMYVAEPLRHTVITANLIKYR